MSHNGHIVRLAIGSSFEMLDFVQAVSDAVARLAGLDEDATHWIGVAVRESVINAIRHGNREDASKRVTVEFSVEPWPRPAELVVRVLDEGEGFDPSVLTDPRAPENLLKATGRGIFFMRSFMDEVTLRRRPAGGMEVRMVKKLRAPAGSTDPAAGTP